jgi:hypothetical protein
MPDILLSNDDITVLGGPAIVNLEVDFGPQGDRGSQIFICNGDPNETAIGQTPKVFDLCINNLRLHEDYLAYYQYINNAGTNEWVKLFNLIPNTYSLNDTGTFSSSGVRHINVPLINIVPAELIGSVTAANFNVQYSILNQNPVSSSISIGEIITDGDNLALPISIKAVEYSNNSWSNLTGVQTVHLFITVV